MHFECAEPRFQRKQLRKLRASRPRETGQAAGIAITTFPFSEASRRVEKPSVPGQAGPGTIAGRRTSSSDRNLQTTENERTLAQRQAETIISNPERVSIVFAVLGNWRTIQERALSIAISFLAVLERINTWILAICRKIAIVAMALMVVVILLQVFFRYVLNNALPWPDEAARFLMLWMTGLMAPSAYRWGSFVSIDIVKDMLGRRAGTALTLLILLLGLCVLLVALVFADRHITSGWLFNSSSLKLPLQLIGMESVRIKLAWMYMSLPLGFCLMILVSVELILKNIHMLLDSSVEYGSVPDQIKASAE